MRERIVKSGFVHGKQRYKCKDCNINFAEGGARTNDKIAAKKAMRVILYTLGKASYNMLAKIFDTWPSLVYRRIAEAGAKLPEQEVSGDIKEMEFDEMRHFVKEKKTSAGSSPRHTANCCPGRRLVSPNASGGRDIAAFRRLYEKVKHLKTCIFYTDNRDAFTKVLPPERHVIGKNGTHTIERDNSNTRHHLGRFTRRTKIVTKKDEMIDTSLKLWQALTLPDTFIAFQLAALSVYR